MLNSARGGGGGVLVSQKEGEKDKASSVQSGDLTALGFDNGKNLTPSSLGLINQGDVAACCGVGCD